MRKIHVSMVANAIRMVSVDSVALVEVHSLDSAAKIVSEKNEYEVRHEEIFFKESIHVLLNHAEMVELASL